MALPNRARGSDLRAPRASFSAHVQGAARCAGAFSQMSRGVAYMQSVFHPAGQRSFTRTAHVYLSFCFFAVSARHSPFGDERAFGSFAVGGRLTSFWIDRRRRATRLVSSCLSASNDEAQQPAGSGSNGGYELLYSRRRTGTAAGMGWGCFDGTEREKSFFAPMFEPSRTDVRAVVLARSCLCYSCVLGQASFLLSSGPGARCRYCTVLY